MKPSRRKTAWLPDFLTLLVLGLFTLQTPALHAESLNTIFSGEDDMVVVVDQFLAYLSEDVRINHIFFETAVTDVRAKLLQDICVETSSHCHAAGTDSVQQFDFHLNANDSSIVMQHLHKAMENRHVAAAIQQRLSNKLTLITDTQVLADLPLASL